MIVNPISSLIKIFQLDRVDLIVFTKKDGLEEIRKQNLQNIIKKNSPSLLKINMYHYLHKNNQELINKISMYIQQLKENGNLQEIINQANERTLLK